MKLLLELIQNDDARSPMSHGPFEAAPEQDIIIGRSSEATVALEDRSISRRHARIFFKDGDWWLRDLDSRYGTRLNDVAIDADVKLVEMDRILLGRLEFMVVNGDDDIAASPPVAVAETDHNLRYQLLLDILETIAGNLSLNEIMETVIAKAGEAVDASRGFILLLDDDSGRLRPDTIVAWRKGVRQTITELVLSSEELGQISQTVLREALDTGQSVFLKFALTDPRYQEAMSIQAQEVQTLLCCPMLVSDKRVGAFYLDRMHKGSRPFTDEDRELLESIAGLAARTLEKEQLLTERNRSEKLALLGTMVSRITHELKNPLYNIRGTVENILEKLRDEGIPPADLNNRLARVLKGVTKAERRMNGLLKFSRPTQGKRRRIQLSRVLNAAAVEVMSLCEENGVKLSLDYRKGIQILGDSDALEQVFSNLLVNAAQAMPNGGEIIISCKLERRLGGETPDWLVIKIADNGPGLPETEIERIFEDFFTTKSTSGGTGLGLAICRHIIEQHQGTVNAENLPEGGALFRIGLPLPSQKL
ncbi:MAG: FHA domain-containing protein [bacterium]|nr:FHA domain-containing protein [bacterium]